MPLESALFDALGFGGEKAFGVEPVAAGTARGIAGGIEGGIAMPGDDIGRTEPMCAAGAIICGVGFITGLGFVISAGGAFDFEGSAAAVGRGPGGCGAIGGGCCDAIGGGCCDAIGGGCCDAICAGGGPYAPDPIFATCACGASCGALGAATGADVIAIVRSPYDGGTAIDTGMGSGDALSEAAPAAIAAALCAGSSASVDGGLIGSAIGSVPQGGGAITGELGGIDGARGASGATPPRGPIEIGGFFGASTAVPPDIGGADSLIRLVIGGTLAGGRSITVRARSWGTPSSVVASSWFSRRPKPGAFAAGATPTIVCLCFERAEPPGRGLRDAPSELDTSRSGTCFRPSPPTSAPIRKLK